MDDTGNPANSVRFVEVDEASEGQRIDNFLIKILKGVPKSRIYRCLRRGEVRVNGGRIKASTKLNLGDKVRIPPIRVSSATTVKASGNLLEIINNSIVYEDDRILVLNKPSGLAVHGGSGVSLGVIENIRQLRPKAKSLELVHRLDKDTSGCLMISKKTSYMKRLQKLLSNKSAFGKHYSAVVHGCWPKRKQHIDLPLKKNVLASGERISSVATDGKPSVTEVSVVRQTSDYSLLDIRPLTGRTHQIRVHCQYIGYPIVGDEKYGLEELDRNLRKQGYRRLMLHASRLEIPETSAGEPAISVSAEVDEAFSKMIKNLLK